MLRHDGAPHIKSAALQMTIVEYYNIDAYVILAIPIIFIMTMLIYFAKYLRRIYFVKIDEKDKIKIN